MKDFILADKGWRTNAQLGDQPRAKTRGGRQDRAIAAKVVHRVFVQVDWDTTYPFEQYVPKGKQDVPPMRGWRLVPEVWAHVYYGASRLQLAHKGKGVDEDDMNVICKNFVNPFVQYTDSSERGFATLATKVLHQWHCRREHSLHWPSLTERLARVFARSRPVGMTDDEWTKYCGRVQGGN